MSKSRKKPQPRPVPAQDLVQRGIELANQARWPECVLALEAAVKREPGQVVAQLNLARAYLYVSKLDEAVSLAAEVRRAQPQLELAALIQAEAFNRMQRFAEAQATLLTLPEASRTTKAYWFSLGYAQQLQGLHQLAIESFMKALSIRMDDAQS
ncbi:MAG: hypothetical protein E6Q94_05225, partial [Burkholderiaceae bacterium]